MSSIKLRLISAVIVMASGIALCLAAPTTNIVSAQQPTGSIPTVTGTPEGVIVGVYLDLEQIDVYSGPSTYLYPAIGVLLAGEQVPALAISEDEQWLEIYYPGVPESVAWVYAPYVQIIKNGDLPVLGAPPTPTPASTPTIDPTLEAAFVVPQTPTRLPSFTPPPPLEIATFDDANSGGNGIPAGLLIFGLGFLGALGVLISFLQGR